MTASPIQSLRRAARNGRAPGPALRNLGLTFLCLATSAGQGAAAPRGAPALAEISTLLQIEENAPEHLTHFVENGIGFLLTSAAAVMVLSSAQTIRPRQRLAKRCRSA